MTAKGATKGKAPTPIAAEPEAPKRGRPWPADHEVADSQIQLRVTRSRKAAYVKVAQAQGKTLAQWVFDCCDRAVLGR